ncbi:MULTISPECIES: hypothetical protein [unclassified Rhizobium]|uniref:hypothetical protein n=1 Tax=unclassified Rhizobium TaxID=2613769 RepID=UPI0010475323|nr:MULTISPECIES: hypothetical protein [unclassified Rhizobium]MBB4166906.1 hypothetical protein [Rhizobium sp. BK538]
MATREQSTGGGKQDRRLFGAGGDDIDHSEVRSREVRLLGQHGLKPSELFAKRRAFGFDRGLVRGVEKRPGVGDDRRQHLEDVRYDRGSSGGPTKPTYIHR